MEQNEMQTPAPKAPSIKRRAVSLSSQSLIEFMPLNPEQSLPIVCRPSVDGVNLAAWCAANSSLIEQNLLQYGGILFRGFPINSSEQFHEVAFANATELLDYTYRSTPRSHVGNHIYTSTEYPADKHIPLHNEMSYVRSWPMKIWFYSAVVAQKDGETPIADSRKVFQALDPAIRKAFGEKKVMYVRNYSNGLDLSWQNVFQTSDPDAVESFCKSSGIEYEWRPDQRLRTRQVCQGIACHPKTQEWVWFNQAHLFHVSSLDAELQATLLADFSEEDLPRNAYYGDGSPIESSVLDEIREVYANNTIAFPWEQGDILLLDNMLAAHGRRPFVGPRKVLVAMAEPNGDHTPVLPELS